MKKLLCVNIIFLVGGIFSFVTQSSLAAEDTSGKFSVLADLSGNVQISHDGAVSWQAIYVGDFLAEGDWIKTETAAKATIGFDPDLLNTVTLQENSRARVDQLRSNIQALQLPEGTVTSLMNGLKSGEEFQVQTPTAVIGVRGTGFTVQVAPGGQTTVIQVEEGKVQVSQSSETQTTQAPIQTAEATPEKSVQVTPSGIAQPDTATKEALHHLWQKEQENLRELKEKHLKENWPERVREKVKEKFRVKPEPPGVTVGAPAVGEPTHPQSAAPTDGKSVAPTASAPGKSVPPGINQDAK